jgi:hypothetical protein
MRFIIKLENSLSPTYLTKSEDHNTQNNNFDICSLWDILCVSL